MKNITVIVGSRRKGSYSMMLANAFMKLAPSNLKLNVADLSNLEMYNQDFDADTPKAYLDFKELIKNSDGLLFITPEHNRSIPALLKNAIDCASRPYGKNSWNNKPGAVVSSSIGGVGGFGAYHHLRQILSALNVHLMSQPEMYIGTVQSLFDQDGNLTNEDTKKFFTSFMEKFDQWVNKFS